MSVVNRSPTKLDNSVSDSSGSDVISRANHCLLYKDFERCLEICLKGIGMAKNYPEQHGSTQTIEALSILATQAYAELNRWQEVLPFITQLYNGIEDCPAKIVQLCVLLHAHMKDFAACSAIAHIWLRNPNNAESPEYTKLVEIFITRVLQRQNRLSDVPAFLDSCPALQDEQKEVYKRFADYREKERVSKAKEDKDKAGKSQAKDSIGDSDQQSKEVHAIGFFGKINQMITRFIPPTAWYLIKRIAMLSIFIYWILTRANFDLLSNQRIMGIFSAVLRLWRSMFAPHYVTK